MNRTPTVGDPYELGGDDVEWNPTGPYDATPPTGQRILLHRLAIFEPVTLTVASEAESQRAHVAAFRSVWIASHPSAPAPPSVGPFATTTDEDLAREAWRTWAAAHPGEALAARYLGAFLSPQQEPARPSLGAAVLDVRPGLVRPVVFAIARERDWLRARAAAYRSAWIAAHPSDPAPPSVGPFATTTDEDSARSTWSAWAAANPGEALSVLYLGAFLPLEQVAPRWGWPRVDRPLPPRPPRCLQ